MKTKSILLGALALTMLAACDNDDDQGFPRDGQVTFTATIGGQYVTRAYDTSWDKNDKIGISGTGYTNVPYQTANADGDFTVAPNVSPIYYQDGSTVTFTAYYPWNKLEQGTKTIAADTWGQAEQKSFDFLWAQATGSNGSGPVAFEFAHKMTKVVLTIVPGDDVSSYDVKNAVLSLEGFKHAGTFNVETGETATTDASTAMWEFANNTETAAYNAPLVDNEDGSISYTLILFPQVFGSPLPIFAETPGLTFSTTLDFTAANRSAKDEEPKNEWVAGRQYNMRVTLNKTDISVSGCTIGKWEEADGGTADAY